MTASNFAKSGTASALGLALLGLLSAFPLFTRASPPPPEKLVILVNTSGNDLRGRGDQDLDDGYTLMALERQFPRERVLLVRATDNDELRQRLRETVAGSARIAALYVTSHGASLDKTELVPRLKDRNLSPNERFLPQIFNEDETFFVELNREKSVRSAFEPVIGKFDRGAKLMFEGCETISTGNLAQKKAVMEQIARNFGLVSGSLYMNETRGSMAFRSAFLQPAWGLPEARLQALAIQASWPLSLPALLYMDLMHKNQGYTLTVEPGSSTLKRDHLIRTLLLDRPTP